MLIHGETERWRESKRGLVPWRRGAGALPCYRVSCSPTVAVVLRSTSHSNPLPGPALSIGDIGGRLERHLLEGRRDAPLQQKNKNKIFLKQ